MDIYKYGLINKTAPHKERGKIGPYAHTPFNFLNLTEIVLYWLLYPENKS